MTDLVDIAVVTSWAAVLVHNALLALRGVGRADSARGALGLGVIVVVLVLGVRLEARSGGRWALGPGLALGGALLVAVGAAVHVHARRVLGASWSPRVATDRPLVETGPYGVVRHPLYAALLVMAVGTFLAHPSLATACGTAGLATGLLLKMRREERALAAALGPRWDAYRRRVPCLLPRLSRAASR